MEAARERLTERSLEIVPRHVVTDDRLTHLLFALDAERARGYSAGKLFVDSIETALANILLTSFNTFTPRSIPRKGANRSAGTRRGTERRNRNHKRGNPIAARELLPHTSPSRKYRIDIEGGL